MADSKYKIMGFLAQYGWEGVANVFFLIVIGAIIGTFLFYFLLVYKKDLPPARKEGPVD